MDTLHSFGYPVDAKPLLTAKNTAWLLLITDVFGLLVCLQAAFGLRLGQPLDLSNLVLYGFVLLVLTGLYLADTYKPESQIAGLRAPARIIISNTAVAGIMAALIYLSGTWGTNSLLNRGTWLPSLVLFTLWSVATRLGVASWMRAQAKQSSWLLLSSRESAVKFEQDFLQRSPYGRIVVLSENPQELLHCLKDELNDVGSLHELPIWMNQRWSGILVSPQLKLSGEQMQQLMRLRLRGTQVYRLSDFYETFWYKLPSALLQDTWFTFSAGFRLISGRISLKLKRLVDIWAATLLLVLLSPIMLLAAVAIKLDSPGPIFYSQMRTGLHCNPFQVYKFRSMYQNAEAKGVQWAQKRDPRVTRVGYWLRLMRIDELPQIWNVLRGNMSLIGPRPERPEFDAELERLIPYYGVRYLVKPGITGWAQVMYPYGASVEDAYEKLAYDLYYIKNYSIWLDIAIAFKTIRIVFLGKGR